MATGAVQVKGYRELDRAFGELAKDLKRDNRKALRVVAEPVRRTAENLAVGNISNIGSHWSRMRLGVTARAVYLAPTSRRAGGSPRANLADLLMDKSMQPALDENEALIVAGLERWVDGLSARQGF